MSFRHTSLFEMSLCRLDDPNIWIFREETMCWHAHSWLILMKNSCRIDSITHRLKLTFYPSKSSSCISKIIDKKDSSFFRKIWGSLERSHIHSSLFIPRAIRIRMIISKWFPERFCYMRSDGDSSFRHRHDRIILNSRVLYFLGKLLSKTGIISVSKIYSWDTTIIFYIIFPWLTKNKNPSCGKERWVFRI